MELSDAISTVQGLRNLFRGLEKLDEVLRVAQSADQAAAEKAALTELRARELAEVEQQLADARATANQEAVKASRAHTMRMNALDAEMNDAVSMFSKAKTAMADELAAAKTDHDNKVTLLGAEIQALASQRDELSAAVVELQGHLEALKARIAGA